MQPNPENPIRDTSTTSGKSNPTNLSPEKRAEMMEVYRQGGIEEVELWMEAELETHIIETLGPEEGRTYLDYADIGRSHYHSHTPRQTTDYLFRLYASRFNSTTPS